jgi:hypothetical protein
LHIDIYSADGGNPTDREVLQCLIRVDAIRKATVMGNMETPTVRFSAEGRWTTTGVAKRKIVITQRSEGDD